MDVVEIFATSILFLTEHFKMMFFFDYKRILKKITVVLFFHFLNIFALKNYPYSFRNKILVEKTIIN